MQEVCEEEELRVLREQQLPDSLISQKQTFMTFILNLLQLISKVRQRSSRDVMRSLLSVRG